MVLKQRFGMESRHNSFANGRKSYVHFVCNLGTQKCTHTLVSHTMVTQANILDIVLFIVYLCDFWLGNSHKHTSSISTIIGTDLTDVPYKSKTAKVSLKARYITIMT